MFFFLSSIFKNYGHFRRYSNVMMSRLRFVQFAYDRDDRSNAELPSDFSIRMLYKHKLFCWSHRYDSSGKRTLDKFGALSVAKKQTS